MLLSHLLNGNVSSKNIDIKLSRSIFAHRKSFGVIEFTRQVGYAKREMHGELPAGRGSPVRLTNLLHPFRLSITHTSPPLSHYLTPQGKLVITSLYVFYGPYSVFL